MNSTSDIEQAEFLQTLTSKSTGGTLRGDYAQADARYVVQQEMAVYTPAQHALWRRLYQRQAKLLPGRACDVFIENLAALDAADGIPEFARTSKALFKATGWVLVAVPGLVPDHIFFEHLAQKRFPVTVWLREEHEFDYIVEPDVFHDFFGHVPLLFNPVFAAHLQAYGKGALKAMLLGGLDYLARLYWYTIEFGLIHSPQGLRIYGAGILSSAGEIEYSLHSPVPQRLRLDVERVMSTTFKIDAYQESYFVIDDFEQLFHDTEPDFTLLYARLKLRQPLAANTLLAGEAALPPNAQ